MTPEAILQATLPTLVPILIGFVLARFAALGAGALHVLLRFALVPLALFVLFTMPVTPKRAAVLVGCGVVLVLFSRFISRIATQQLRLPVAAGIASPHVVAFAVPFLWHSLGGAGSAFGAALVFVGVAVALAFGEGASFRTIFREPWLYAVVAGIAWRWLPFELRVGAYVDTIARAAYPLLLIYLGTLLHPRVDLGDGRAWSTALARVLVGFGVAYAAVELFSLPRGLRDGLFIAALAPAASAGASFAHGGSAEQEGGLGPGILVSLGAAVALKLTGFGF